VVPRGVEASFEVPGLVGAAEGGQEADGGSGGSFHVGVEGAGLVVGFQDPFAEGAELQEGFDAGDGEGLAVVLVEPVVFESSGEWAAA
jgi:hypothetical protein